LTFHGKGGDLFPMEPQNGRRSGAAAGKMLLCIGAALLLALCVLRSQSARTPSGGIACGGMDLVASAATHLARSNGSPLPGSPGKQATAFGEVEEDVSGEGDGETEEKSWRTIECLSPTFSEVDGTRRRSRSDLPFVEVHVAASLARGPPSHFTC
jgi:hypothetical protein